MYLSNCILTLIAYLFVVRCSIASSSGVSSSSGSGSKRNQGAPGPIDNSSLVAEPVFKVGTLTGEGNPAHFVYFDIGIDTH